jgi:hypothetical protein
VACSEVGGAVFRTLGFELHDGVVAKLYPDVWLFWGLIYSCAGVAVVGTRVASVGTCLRRRVACGKRRVYSVGELLLASMFILATAAFVFYWAHDHNWHSSWPAGLVMGG